MLFNKILFKIMKKLFSFFAICCASAMLFTACEPGSSVNYPTSYLYEVGQDIQYLCYDSYEAAEIQTAFNKAIGNDGSMIVAHKAPQDEQMKAACEEVKKQHADAKSIYLKYDLYRITTSAEPGVEKKSEIIGSYIMGQALTKTYTYYSILSNEDEAYAALEAQKESLDETVYNNSYHTLLRLLGVHKSSGGSYVHSESVFEARFRNVFDKLEEDYPPFDTYVATVCDSIANAHASDVLTVEAKVQVVKYQFLKEGQTEVWKHTFAPTVQ